MYEGVMGNLVAFACKLSNTIFDAKDFLEGWFKIDVVI